MMITRQCLSKFELMLDINDKFVQSPGFILNSKELDIETIEDILSFMDNIYSYNKLCNEISEIIIRNPSSKCVNDECSCSSAICCISWACRPLHCDSEEMDIDSGIHDKVYDDNDVNDNDAAHSYLEYMANGDTLVLTQDDYTSEQDQREQDDDILTQDKNIPASNDNITTQHENISTQDNNVITVTSQPVECAFLGLVSTRHTSRIALLVVNGNW